VTWRLDIRPEAEDDIRQAARWYENEQTGLGVDFTEIAYAGIDSLADNPLLYRLRARYRRREIRWLLTSRFPYRVIYYLEDDSIRIFAVLHAKRSERFWRERLN